MSPPLSFLSPETSLSLLSAAEKKPLALKGDKLFSLAGPTPDAEQINKAAQDFESMMITEMIRPMFETLEVDPMFGGGKGEEVFRSLLVDEYGKAITKSGGIGMAEYVKNELLRIQEESGRPVSTETGTEG